VPIDRPLLVAVCLFACSTTASAQQPPTLAEQRNGNVTNLSVTGQLAPTRSLECLDVEQVEGVYTPADLHTGVKRCITQGDFDRAARLMFVAGLYARFDAERVTDVSVRDTAQVLNLQTVQTLTADQKAALQKALLPLTHDGNDKTTFCASVARLARPDYFPTYMILHGAMAAANVANGRPPWSGDPLVPGFDAATTWARLPQTYVHCS
jgi:hypothetical protein